jgi:hypothetical protein
MSSDPTITSTAPGINPGQIIISGGGTLVEWKAGGDNTVIQGGTITSDNVNITGMKIGQVTPLYLVSYSTESGDRGIVGLFNQFPTDKHLEAITETRYPDEIEDGVSYIEYTVKRIDQIETLPTIS